MDNLLGKTARFFYVSECQKPPCKWKCRSHRSEWIEAKIVEVKNNSDDPELIVLDPMDQNHRINLALSEVKIIE